MFEVILVGTNFDKSGCTYYITRVDTDCVSSWSWDGYVSVADLEQRLSSKLE